MNSIIRMQPCRPIPRSNIQAFPGNKFRSGLGTSLSPSVKKGPVVVYRPAVGSVKVRCCKLPVQLIISFLDGGNPAGSGSITYDGGTPSTNGENVDGGKP